MTISPFTVKGSDGVTRTLDEHYDTQKDVEQDPYGAWLAIQNLSEQNRKLRELLLEYRTKTPLGHQPHMIAHRVDAAIAEGGEG